MASPEHELIEEGNPLHTRLKSYLEAGYGVPRNAKRVVVIIEDGKPLEVHAEYHPEARKQPDYGRAVQAFAEDRRQRATPSPTNTLVPPPQLNRAMAESMAGPLPDDTFVVDADPIKIEKDDQRIASLASWRTSTPSPSVTKTVEFLDGGVASVELVEGAPWDGPELEYVP